MRLPRDHSGRELVKVLELLGYHATRQKGSHVRLTTTEQGEHHITIPLHDAIRIGTLQAILTSIATHFGVTRDEIANRLFGSQ